MKIVLIRHFRTPGNLQKRYIGRTDESLLEEEGLPVRAGRLKRRILKAGPVDKVAVSPMKRCRQSAALLFPEHEPLSCQDLRECDFGIFEGKNYTELQGSSAYQAWLDSGGTIPFPSGEGHEDFKRRCRRGFEEVLLQFCGAKARYGAIILHGGTIMAVMSGFDREKRGFYSWQAENGGGYIVTLDEMAWNQGKKIFREIERL